MVPTTPGTKRVVVLGDSVPAWLLKDAPKAINTKRLTVVNATLESCDGARNDPPARSQSGAIVPTPAACAKGWPSMYPPYLTIRPGVALVMTSTHAMLDHRLSGTWYHPCHTPARNWYRADMTARLRYLRGKATKVVLVLPAWLTSKSRWIMPADYVKRADCVRAVLKDAARAAGVTTLDFGAYLCPGGATTCKPWRTGDGMHIDKAESATVLTWLLNRAAPATPAT